jgi:ribosomal protein L7Ae-like RNA K-turn-binding protein
VVRRQFSRAFKGDVGVGTADDLLADLDGRMKERLASYLALANKGGKVFSGSDTVKEVLKGRVVGVMFLASDISAENGAKFRHLAAAVDVPCISFFDMDRLGALLGKESRSVVAVAQSGFSEAIGKEMNRYLSFFQGGVQSR